MKIIKYWLPFILWAYLIYLFSSRPTGVVSEIHLGDFIIKKTAHVVEYAVLALLLYRALKAYKIKIGLAAIVAVIFSLVYAATDEFHQSFTPGREPRVRDIIFDIIGAVGSIYFIRNYADRLKGRLRKLLQELELI